jgi:hypothetical protein
MRDIRAGRLVDEDLLLDLAETLAAERYRPPDAQPAVATHAAHQPPVHLAVPVGQHGLPLTGGQQPRRSRTAVRPAARAARR